MRPQIPEPFCSASTKASFLSVALFAFLIACVGQLANAQTYSVIHTFTNAPDGAVPYAGLTIDDAGNLYGTTSLGGYVGTAVCNEGCGTVFKMAHTESGWTNAILYAFRPLPFDGVIPSSRVIFGPDGALYGNTYEGGAYYLGTVFRLTPPSNPCNTAPCPWKESFYSFTPDYLHGAGPIADVVFDRNGNLYGTTVLGGTETCERSPNACGVVYEIAAPVQQWQESVIHNYMQSTGSQPYAGIIFDNSGNIFGVTTAGGTDDEGTVYEMTQSGGSWTYNVLYNFTAQNDGSRPDGNLIQDASGDLYGTTALAGSGGGGTVFELSPSGGGWTFSVIHSFTGTEGPVDALTMDAGGNLYGTTYKDGAYGFGNVFKLSPSNGSWVYTSLYDFTGGADGGNPLSNVTMDSAGNLYGTAAYGGSDRRLCGGGCGVVWEITP
jgi:uncharacterized repeat protein (TIGR03803 family)